MTAPLEMPQKYGYLYVDFYNPGTATHYKYTNWADPADGSYAFQPKLNVIVADNTGTFEQKVTEVELPIGDTFAALVGSGDPLPPIFVTVTERIEDPFGVAPASTLILFKGQIAKVTRNPRGRSGSIKIECVSMKFNLDVPLGLPCTQQCVWTFGGVGCEKDLAPLKKNGTCTVINQNRTITITGLPGAPDVTYWRQGYVTRNGLSIVIRDWDSTVSATLFTLRERPPVEWIGQLVVVTPGCDKSKETCANRWANIGQFGGFGVAMPDYHPNIESG